MSEQRIGEASAPASVANLGPGFDCLAVAIDLRCSVQASISEEWSVQHVGIEQPIAPEDDAVLAAARVAVGNDRPLALRMSTDIPIGKGLGSSSAAHVAGALAAWRAYGEDPPLHTVFELVSAMEGHPDNAAAAVYGGLVLCAATGPVRRLPWHPSLRPLVAVPVLGLPTKDARAVLPGAYRSDEVVRSLSRLAGLVAGILTGDAVLLSDASGDEIHESHREVSWPAVGRLIDVARSAGAAHAAWSGAGPSVVAFVTADTEKTVRKAMAAEMDEGGVVLDPGVATRGVV